MRHRELLTIVVLGGLLAAGCAGKRRIEGAEEPVQPSTTPTPVIVAAVPTPTEQPAPPPPAAEEPAPPAPPEVKAEPTPTPEPEAPPAPAPPEAENNCTNYIVVKGDTLWDIAKMDLAYKDNFQWPLIFKANRDQIKDPDLIYPKQEFCIRHDFTQAEIEKARNDASDTPKFVPHTKPRETLPIDYF
jgi:nucleoid-associated protein YgaU